MSEPIQVDISASDTPTYEAIGVQPSTNPSGQSQPVNVSPNPDASSEQPATNLNEQSQPVNVSPTYEAIGEQPATNLNEQSQPVSVKKATNFRGIKWEVLNDLMGQFNIDEHITQLINADKKLNEIITFFVENDETITDTANSLANSLLELQKNIIQFIVKQINKTIKEKEIEKDDDAIKLLEEYKKKVKALMEELDKKAKQLNQVIQKKNDTPTIVEVTEQGKTTVTQGKSIIGKKSGAEAIKQLEEQQDNRITSTIETINNLLGSIKPEDLERKPVNIENTPLGQEGGLLQVDLNNKLLIIKKIFNVYNSDLILKLTTVINYPDVYKNVDSRYSYFNYFFQELSSEFIEKLPNICYGYERDTFIYQQHPTVKNSKNYQFKFNLFNNIYTVLTEDPDMIFTDNTNTELINESLSNIVSSTFELISLIPTIYKTTSSPTGILNDKKYITLFPKDKVLTYIKIRNDTAQDSNAAIKINPRFTIQKKNNQVLLRYINVHDTATSKVDYPNGKEYTEEIRELAKKPENKEYYYFGPFNGIFPAETTNNKVARSEELKVLVDKLANGQDACVIGYGQSGSGKTSALINFVNKEGVATKGILMELCTDEKIRAEYTKAELEMINLFVNYDEKLVTFVGRNTQLNAFEDYHYVETKIKLKDHPDLDKYTFEYKNDDWLFTKNNKLNMGGIIEYGFDAREVEPTPNNPDSSRSHVVVCVTFSNADGSKKVKLVVCDLAGVENVFDCMDTKTLKKFDEKYALFSKKYSVYKEDDVERKNPKNPKKYIDFGQEYIEKQANKQDLHININSTSLAKFYEPIAKKLTEYDQEEYKNIYNQDVQNDNSIISLQRGGSDNFKNFMVPPPKIPNYCNTKLGVELTDLDMLDIIAKNDDFKDIEKAIGARIKEKKERDVQKEIDKFNTIIKIFQKPMGLNFSTNYNTSINVLKDAIQRNKNTLLPHFTSGFNENIDTLDKFMFDNFNDYLKNTIVEAQSSPEHPLKSRIDSTISGYARDKKDNMIEILLNNLNNKEYLKAYNNIKTDADIQRLYFKIMYGMTFAGETPPNKDTDIYKLALEKKDNLEKNKKLFNAETLKSVCTDIRLHALIFNCRLRVMEGYMINRSLADLRERIKDEVLESIKIQDPKDPSKYYLPIMYHKPTATYKTNTFIELNAYSKFVPSNKPKTNSKLLNIVRDKFGAELNNMTYVVFTVINLTNKDIVNNPPNPPFININKLNYKKELLNITTNKNEIRKEIIQEGIKLFNKIKQYKFYSDRINPTMLSAPLVDDIYKIMDIINNTNPATLIGSLVSTEIIRNPFSNSLLNSYLDGSNLLSNIIRTILIAKGDNKKYTNEQLGIENFENINEKLDEISKLDNYSTLDDMTGGFKNFLKYKLSRFY
jgi:hypothetical protein